MVHLSLQRRKNNIVLNKYLMSKFTTSSNSSLMQKGLLDAKALAAAVDQFASIKGGAFKNPDHQVIDLVKKFSDEQMQQICAAYYVKFNASISAFVKNLVKDEACKELTLLVMAPLHDSWAQCLHIAMSDMDENSDLLVSAILMMRPTDVHKTKIAYKIRYNNTLEHDLAEKIKGLEFWDKLLMAWMKRDQIGYVSNRYNQKGDAIALLKATLGIGTDEQVYVDILSKSTQEEFPQIMKEFTPLTIRGYQEASLDEQKEIAAEYTAKHKGDPKYAKGWQYTMATQDEKVAIDQKMREQSKRDFAQVIDDEFSGKNLDNFAAHIAHLRLMNVKQALDYIFSKSFNQATEYQKGDKSDEGKSVDKPMMNFLLCIFREQLELSPEQIKALNDRLPGKASLSKDKEYAEAVRAYFGIKQ